MYCGVVFRVKACALREMDVDEIWREATERERRVLIEDLLEGVDVFPDHFEVRVAGVPRLNVLLEEVGLHQKVQFCGVGESTRTLCTPVVLRGELGLAG